MKWKCVVMVGRQRMVFCFSYILLSLPSVWQVTHRRKYFKLLAIIILSPTVALLVPYLRLFCLLFSRACRYHQAFGICRLSSDIRGHFQISVDISGHPKVSVTYIYIKYSLMRRDIPEAWLTNLMLDFISAGYLQAGLAACEP